jgi:hypothetical protein
MKYLIYQSTYDVVWKVSTKEKNFDLQICYT